MCHSCLWFLFSCPLLSFPPFPSCRPSFLLSLSLCQVVEFTFPTVVGKCLILSRVIYLHLERPDGISVLPSIGNKTGVLCILEFKHMSDVTDQYLLRVRLKSANHWIRIPPNRPGCRDTSPRLEGETNQLYNGVTFRERTGPKVKGSQPDPDGKHT